MKSKGNIQARMQNHFCSRVAICRPITYSECVCVCVALVIQHAKRLSRITRTLLFVAYLVLPCFTTLSQKGHEFPKKKKLLDFKKRVRFSLQLMSKKSLILRRTKRDVMINVHRSASAVPEFLVRL